MTFPMTELRAPIKQPDKVHLAASTVASLGQMRDPRGPKHARIRTAHTIDRTRLKSPFLTIYPASFTEHKQWATVVRQQTRFYLNSPALKCIFPNVGIQPPKTAYLTIDCDHHELRIDWRPGGHPAKINPSVSSYFRSGHIADRLRLGGYLEGDQPTYIPLSADHGVLIADLTHAGSKRDAVAYEEERTCRSEKVRSTRVPPRFFIRADHAAEEERVYQIYRDHTAREGKPPSLRAVADQLGVHYVTVMRHLDDLERKGRLARITHGRLTVSMTFPLEQP